jgi:hypothetical protein
MKAEGALAPLEIWDYKVILWKPKNMRTLIFVALNQRTSFLFRICVCFKFEVNILQLFVHKIVRIFIEKEGKQLRKGVIPMKIHRQIEQA